MCICYKIPNNIGKNINLELIIEISFPFLPSLTIDLPLPQYSPPRVSMN